MKSKCAEGAGKTLIQSQSSKIHVKSASAIGSMFPHGALFKLYSSRGRLWASPFFHTILSEFPLTGMAPCAPLCI